MQSDGKLSESVQECKQEPSRSLLKGVSRCFYGSVENTSPAQNTKNMSKFSKGKAHRVISASGAVLPPLPWYKKVRIPGVLTAHPSPYSNKIRSTKYTVFNFIFKNLWEQFHRWANLYFLFMIILNYIPQVEAVGKEVVYIPLFAVLGAIAAKDLFEDYRRFKSDRIVNNRVCAVYDRNTETFVKKKWSEVCLGDFIRLHSDDIIPSDLLLLYSSDPLGICYIETANIDGETNLKQRQVAPGCGHSHKEEMEETFTLGDFTGTLYCEQPHNKIYDFNGYIRTPSGERLGVNRSNLLLQGCVLRNTTSVVGVVVYAGHETKSMKNNSGPQTKRSKLERSINVEVISQVILLFVLCSLGAIVNGIWTYQHLDTNSVFFPYTSENLNIYLEGFIRFWTFLIIFQVIIPVSLYVTIELVKVMQVIFINGDKEMYYEANDFPLQCRALNITEDLGQIQYVFSDKTGTLTENKMSFRCCSVAGINYLHTIKDDLVRVHTEAALNSNLSAIKDDVEETNSPDGKVTLDPVLAASLTDPDVRDFFILMAICNTVIVSSIGRFKSRVEAVPLLDGSDTDKILNKMKYEAESPDEAALVKAAHDYGYILLSRSPTECSLLTPRGEVIGYDVLHTLEFDSTRRCMSIIVREKGTSEIILYCKGADSAIFDRLALKSHERSFFQESGFGDISTASLSERERVDGSRSYLGKPDLTEPKRVRNLTQRHIDGYAKLGLRTLCMAKRVLTEAEYKSWYEERHEAEIALEDRSSLLSKSTHSIENQLTLLGATGIEDRLQAGVPTAIASLQAAGMKVWVLTGDKQETAINIGYSSCLIQSGMEVVVLNAYSMDDCREELTRIQARLRGTEVATMENSSDSMNGSSVNCSTLSDSGPQSVLIRMTGWNKKKRRRRGNVGSVDETLSVALVVDGPTLTHALSPGLKELFLSVACMCKAVMCCRATPLQKAGVVDLVKTGLDQMTLAIGDGANDVSMIQKANVGVGIAGREGMQAVMASDFAMGRFRFLVRLLLVHGHWSYNRLARVMLYFFYKNVAFATLLFWFQIFNGFSGSSAIDSVNLIIFNLVYTSLPIMVMGVADQDLPAHVLMDKKVYYSQGRCSQVYTRLYFWFTILDAFYQSAVTFFVAYGAYCLGDVGLVEFGFLLNTSIVIVVSLHVAVETLHWTAVNHLLLWGSIAVTFIFNYIYCAIDTKQRLVDTLFAMQMASARAEFWFVLLVTPTLTLLPRVLVKVVMQELWPSPIMKARANLRKRRIQTNRTEKVS